MNVNPLFIIQEDLWFLFVCSFFFWFFYFPEILLAKSEP